MTKNEILKAITEWQSHQKVLEAQLVLLYDLTGAQPDSPLMESIYTIATAHTAATSIIIGDESEWLNWWQYECEFGDKPMSASKGGGKLMKVATLKQLAGMIAK